MENLFEDAPAQDEPELVTNEMPEIYQKGAFKANAFQEAEMHWRQAEATYKRLQGLLKQASDIRDKVKNRVKELHNFKDIATAGYTIETKTRVGTIDRKLLKAFYPKVKLEKISNPASVYQLMKLL